MVDSHALANPARRGFIKGVLAIGAAGGLARNLPTGVKIASDLFGDMSAALGSHRLFSSCRDIRETFIGAKSGELMSHFQTFWPLVLNDPEFLPQLQAACSEPSGVNDHRRRVLPAVAAFHSSAAQQADIRERAANVIFDTHDDAMRHNPNREILEILWQNAIASIIRNGINWRYITLEQRILSQGVSVCQLYLAGERALFMAAIHAFHAMLVYRNALRYRAPDSQAEWLDQSIASILAIEKRGATSWFDRLRILIERRGNFEFVLPQMAEILMGHSSFDPEVADFAIATRVHHYSLIQPIASGAMESSFLSAERAATPKTLSLLTDYGVTPQIWYRVRSGASGLLSDMDLRDADALFANYTGLVRSAPVRNYSEAGSASLLAARVPFRNQPERPIVGASLNAEAIERVAENKGFAEGLPGLLLTAEFLQSGGRHLDRATHLRVDKAHGIILKEFSDLIQETLSFFDEWLRDLPASKTNRSTPVGVASSRSDEGAAAHSPSKMEAQLDLDIELNLLRKEISDAWKSIGLTVETAEVTLHDHLENASEVVPQWNAELHAALNNPDDKTKEHD